MNAFNETKKFVTLGILAALALLGIIFVTRSSGKWVCDDGVWVEKDRAKTAQPIEFCPPDKYK